MVVKSVPVPVLSFVRGAEPVIRDLTCFFTGTVNTEWVVVVIRFCYRESITDQIKTKCFFLPTLNRHLIYTRRVH